MKTTSRTLSVVPVALVAGAAVVFHMGRPRVDGRSATSVAIASSASTTMTTTALATKPYGVVELPSNATQFDNGRADKASAQFFPSRASTKYPVTPAHFDQPEVCQGCHADIYAQWKSSVMAISWKDPVYRGLLNLASDDTKGSLEPFCIGCHSPVGLTTHTASVHNSGGADPGGVHCDVCHSISGVSGIGNGAYILAPKMFGRPLKFGPYTDAISPYHDTTYSPLHTKSEFCAACHNVTHPFNALPIERTYEEWRDSAYNGLGVQCQDCHMMPAPGVRKNPGKASPLGKERDNVYTHGFVGGNVSLLDNFGETMQAERSRELLRSAAKLELVELPTSIVPGEPTTFRVQVTNVGAGHKLPTGFPEGREMWIDFHIVDAYGHEVYRLGAVKDGATEPGTKSYKVTLANAKGNVSIRAWEADRVASDTRIPAFGHVTEEFHVVVPRGTPGPVTVRAELNYWPFSPEMLKELGVKNVKAETVLMATVEAKTPIAPPHSR